MSNKKTYYHSMQYLGSKIRPLETIVSVCKELYTPDSYVLDMFSGSGIVSQALHLENIPVIANDVMGFCADIAGAILQVGYNKESISLVDKGLEELRNFKIEETFTVEFADYVAKEEQFLIECNLQKLQELYAVLPQIGKEHQDSTQTRYIKTHYNEVATGQVPLVANYYAGTYFGIAQALEIDRIRQFIDANFAKYKDNWVHNVYLAALYNVVSTVVHSAGKHFAQPLAIKNYKADFIANQRLFTNRQYNIYDLFVESVKAITKTVITKENPSCQVYNEDVMSVAFLNILPDNISVVYADPPYTAQQYSRFYHIPEVIHTYRYPMLQIHKGQITQGLYPDNKFMSAFCSKRKAKDGFASIFNFASNRGAHLVLSYSESKNSKTGNERMISLDELLCMANDMLPNYNLRKIDFTFEYKQLNNGSKVIKEKNDKEFLLIFEKQ